MGKSIDFDRVARYYDLHVGADFDLAFWVEEARRHPGRRLELMCGTGRISLPIVRAGLALSCADYSAGLLRVLQEKLAREELAAPVLQADARALPFAGSFDFIFIGFHAFAELATPEDQLAALGSMKGALRPGGSIVLALHNPAVRGPALDGAWKDLGVFAIPGTTRRLEVRGRYLFDPGTGLAEGAQTYRELEPDGRCVRETTLPLRFLLINLAQLEALAAQAGLRIVLCWGSYAREPFAPGESPVLIATLAA